MKYFPVGEEYCIACKSRDWAETALVQTPALILGKLYPFSVPQFPPLYNWDTIIIYFIALLGGFNEWTHAKLFD